MGDSGDSIELIKLKISSQIPRTNTAVFTSVRLVNHKIRAPSRKKNRGMASKGTQVIKSFQEREREREVTSATASRSLCLNECVKISQHLTLHWNLSGLKIKRLNFIISIYNITITSDHYQDRVSRLQPVAFLSDCISELNAKQVQSHFHVHTQPREDVLQDILQINIRVCVCVCRSNE